VVFDSDVTSSPDTALTSCKSVIPPAVVGGGELSRPRMRFINWMNRCKGPLGDVGRGDGGGATGSDGAMKTGTATGSLVGTMGRTGDKGRAGTEGAGGATGLLVGRVGTTGERLEVGGIVNEVGSNDGAALDGMRVVGRRVVGLRVGRAVANRRVVSTTTSDLVAAAWLDGAGATTRTLFLSSILLRNGSVRLVAKDSGFLDSDIVSTPSLRPITTTRGSKPRI
jgi:hypothetical protein